MARSSEAAELERLAVGRDRVIDLARAVSMVAVAVGHWLVVDLRPDPGGLQAVDVLAVLPEAQYLTWLFQVMPVFFFAGGVAGFRSWRRHAAARGESADRSISPAGAWIAGRLWRLLWPTLPVVAFWVLATQLGRHVLDLDPELLAATRGIALVIWFLAIYAVVIALVPAMEWACRRWGWRVPAGMATAAVVVDLVAGVTGYVSSTTPSWVWINYLAVWGTVTCLGRWWPSRPRVRDRRRGAIVAVAALAVLVATTAAGWYPVSMVGVAGEARSNSLPPTVALLALGLAQVGALLWLRPWLDRHLRRPATYRRVALLGARAMSIYLWHLVAVAVLAVALVLPRAWPAAVVGSADWWLLRPVWVLAAAVITVPVVLVAGRWERPPAIALTTSAVRAGLAVVAASVGWAALAIAGFHAPGMPWGLPIVAVIALASAVVLVRQERLDAGQSASSAAAVRPAMRPENRHPPRKVPSSDR